MGDGFKKLGPWLGEGGELLFKWETWIKAPSPLLTQLVETIEDVFYYKYALYHMSLTFSCIVCVWTGRRTSSSEGNYNHVFSILIPWWLFMVILSVVSFLNKCFLRMNKELNGKACNYILYFFDQTPQLLLSCCTFLSGYWFLGSYYLVSIVADKFFDEPI